MVEALSEVKKYDSLPACINEIAETTSVKLFLDAESNPRAILEYL